MFAQLTSSPYSLAAIILVVLGVTLIVTGFVALIRARIGSFTLQTSLALLTLAAGLLTGMIALGIQGYQTLTHEEVAVLVAVSPLSPQRFTASVTYPDGRVNNFVISGDEVYIDAHILKWQPIANLFGLHTVYELDRIGGRYRDIEQERTAERTIHSLKQTKSVNLFELRQRYAFLSLFLDAKYGSATFIPVTQSTQFELKISTTGLLLREVSGSAKSI